MTAEDTGGEGRGDGGWGSEDETRLLICQSVFRREGARLSREEADALRDAAIAAGRVRTRPEQTFGRADTCIRYFQYYRPDLEALFEEGAAAVTGTSSPKAPPRSS
jgi:hypothetical protein